MKKIFLSLLTIFMVLSLSVVFVKANESTIVSLEEGVQIRTDGNNGLRWVANVTNHKEGNEYGFLFAQGDLAEVTVETTGVEKRVVEGVTEEEPIMSATMVNFPKKAATQDISVVAYVLENGVYSYSNVVVRNLSEVAVNAYEKGIATGDFVEAVYDASETTFNLNGGEFTYPYEFTISRYDSSCWADTNYQVGMNSTGKTSSSGLSWYRLFLTETSEGSGIYHITASGYEVSPADYTYDYMIGAFADSKYDVESVQTVVKMAQDANITNYYVKFLDKIPEASNVCSIRAIAYTDPEILVGESSHVGGGETLPAASKDYYDFAGWCGKSDLSDTPTFKQGKDRTLYAKYTPTTYNIEYELNGGNCSASLVTSYNIESATFALPTATEMTIADGNFGGWYDNVSFSGNPITEITLGSNGNKTLYAKWIMNAPTEVELSAADEAVFAQVTPTIVVDSSFTAGKYSLDGKIYEAGVSAVSSITTALSIAKENDIIYVFDGTYAEALTITTSNLSIIGPNYNVHGNSTRSSEAVITELTTISAKNTTINGLKFTTNGNIKVSANNTLISNVFMAPSKTIACNGQNRQGCIADGANISDLIVANSYIAAPGTSNSYVYQFMSFNNVTNLTIKNNYICNPQQSTISSSYAGMRIYTMKGTFEFVSNTVAWGTDGYVFNLANASGVSTINVTDNIFKDNGLITQTATLTMQSCPATAKINIIGNEFYSFKGSTFTLNNDKGSAVSIKYNYYDTNTNFKLTTKGSAVVSYENNCYMTTLNASTTVTDYGVITSKEALDAAYAEYLSTLA